MSRFRWTRKLVWAGLALLLVGLLAPFLVSLNFWRGRISSALSAGLGRRVRVGAIHPKLFGGLGFEIDNVVVEEDARFGVEPFARMETLRATLGLWSLWADRMQFSSLVFVRPSLNVVRNADGNWNVESLWRAAGPQAASGSPPSARGAWHGTQFHPLPNVQIENGRINFKSGNSKKVFVIDDLDMEIIPPSAATEPWRMSWEGRPNRTDFMVNPVSLFRGRAAFGPFSPAIQPDTGTLARLDLTANDALVSDLLRILTGTDYGIHGSFNLDLHLAGTTSLLRVAGSTEVRGLHRWDLLPPPSAAALHADVAGILDLDRETLELQSVSIPISKGGLTVQGEVTELFHHPRADLEAHLRAVPLEDIVETAKQFTTRLDPGITAHGSMNGRIEIAGGLDTLTGSVGITGAGVREKSTPREARLSDFEVRVDHGEVSAGPMSISLGGGGRMISAFNWNPAKRKVTAKLDSDGLRLDSFLPWARALGSRWGRANFTQGNLALHVNVSSAAGHPEMSGWAQLSDAVLNSSAVNQPIQVRAARLRFEPGVVSVKPVSAELGRLQLRGSFLAKLWPSDTRAPGAGHSASIEFDFQSGDVDLNELDALLNPRYRPRPFFLFGAESPASTFFSGLEAKGALQAASFSYRGTAIQNLKATIDYHDRTLELKSVSGEFAGGLQNGKATINFGAGAPAFSIQCRLADLDLNQLTRRSAAWGGFFSGKLSGNLRLAGSGWDLREVLEHMGGSGEASGANLEIDGIDLTQPGSKPEAITRISSLSSTFQISKKAVLITELKLVPATSMALARYGRESRPALSVSGAVGFDRSLDLVVADKAGGTGRHWGGTLAEPVAEEISASLHSTPN